MTYTAGQKLRASQMSTQACTSATRPAGHTGQTIYETDTGKVLVYTGSAWKSIIPEVAKQLAPGDSGTVTSTSYTNARTGGVAQVGIDFVAPPAGAVRIDWSCGLSNTSATNFSLCSMEARTGTTVGSGTIVLAAADNNALQFSGTLEAKISDYYLLTGLTPGSAYNVRLMFRCNAGTSTFNRPKVLVNSST